MTTEEERRRALAAARQRRLRERRRADDGMERIEVWTRPEHAPAIRAEAARLNGQDGTDGTDEG